MKRLAQVIIPAVFLVLFLASAAWASSATVDVVPSALTVDPAENEEFTVAVYISDASDLYGFSFNMVYDPQVVKVVKPDNTMPTSGDDAVVSGGIFAGRDPDLNAAECLNRFNNDTGLLEFAEVLLGEATGADVSGQTLAATVKFRAVGEGQVHLRFADYDGKLHELDLNAGNPTVLVQLSDSDAQAINYTGPENKVIYVGQSFAVVEGYVSVFLGDGGTGLNSLILSNLKQDVINATFSGMVFNLKQNLADPGTDVTGVNVFIPDDSGDLAKRDANNRVTGKFRITVTDTNSTLLRIGGMGYLARNVEIQQSPGQTLEINTANTPVELYPGDLGSIVPGQGLVLAPDGRVDNVDFSAWLKIYRDSQSQTGPGGQQNAIKADMTKNGIIDNVDFSLWLASYRKIAQQ